MSKDKTIFGLVLARGGSKGIPNKNIKKLNGVPLLGYVLSEAKKSKYLNEVWVSSDDIDILAEAQSFGANTLRRPSKLAQDNSKSIKAIQHFIQQLSQKPDIIVLLNACCPLTKVKDIDGAIELALRTDCSSVTSLVEDFSSHPSKLCYLDKNEIVPIANFATGERQKQEKVYKRNTAIYIAKRGILEEGELFGWDSMGYVMPKERSLDINDMFDWQIAEFLIKKNE